jgi:hypothetical protein
MNFSIFKTPKRRMFKLWYHSNPKQNNLEKRLHPKKMLKVEEGEANENENNNDKIRRIGISRP